MGRGGSPVLPARGRAAEAGKREAEVEGTAAVMAMAAGTPTNGVRMDRLVRRLWTLCRAS